MGHSRRRAGIVGNAVSNIQSIAGQPRYNRLMTGEGNTLAPSLKERADQLIWGDVIERHGFFGRLTASLLRYLFAILRDLLSGQLTLRAMSLVYTTLLSIVPLVAFSFSLLKGFGVHEDLKDQMYIFLEPLGEGGITITNWIMERVENVNGGVLGGIGLAFFIYTAISMVQKVEESFNFVWAVSKPRSFARRFVEYTVVLLVGPLAIVTALGMITPLERELSEYESARYVIQETSRIMPYLLVSATFTFLYVFIPNTKVNPSAAFVGGLTGGFLWASVGLIFTNFIMGSADRQAIYASFAVAIATLIWLYLNWIVLLIGSQVAYYFQNPAYLRIGRRAPRLSNSLRERLALNIMILVGDAFRTTDRVETIGTVADKLALPSVTIEPIIIGLESAGLVTATEKGDLVPGRDINKILLADILAVVRSQGETGSFTAPQFDPRVAALGQTLDSAVGDTVTDHTLADLLDSTRA